MWLSKGPLCTASQGLDQISGHILRAELNQSGRSYQSANFQTFLNTLQFPIKNMEIFQFNWKSELYNLL